MNWKYLSRLMIVIATLFLAINPTWAQGRRGGGGKAGNSAKNGDKPGKDSKNSVKPYDDVIPEDAVTVKGLFMVHRVNDDLFYEIPLSALNVDMLWVTQIEETSAGRAVAGAPVGDRVVRWEILGDKILLRDVKYGLRAQTDDPIAKAVKASNLAPIIRVFPVKAYGKDKAPVINVTSLFTKDVPEFAAGDALGAGAMDSSRSFIQQAQAYPDNIEIKVLASYSPGTPNPAGPGGRGRRGGRKSSGATAVIHHSMVKLPERLMKPRIQDDRVGFFSVGFTDFADDSKHETEHVRYITRWRLEKKNPEQEVSDPVKPIVIYVGRGVPEKWKPFVKAAIEAWGPAFEAAGFSNAIIAKYAPDEREDPDWDAEDARISTIRWLPSDIENAFGPQVHDPRTGEILEADIRIYHNVQKLVRDWYFVQASASDKRARKLPMPDDLIGELIQFVVSHELGHSLGFPHNMKASHSYTVAQLRDPEWTKKNGTAPSIMDYARFNYVAQPEDGAALMPGIGPYDRFAVNWGYHQFADTADEKAELEKLLKQQIDNPIYRFGAGDYTSQSEDLTNDAIEATTLGMKNLERILGFMVEATCREGEDYSLLDNMYGQLMGQWGRELGHVTSIVGGVEEINLYYGDAEQRYFPASGDRQRQAVSFLVNQLFETPTQLLSDDISKRLGPDGMAAKLLSQQNRVLGSLLSARRMDRMAELANGNADGYSPINMLTDLRNGIFREFTDQKKPEISLYRRNLQRSFVDQIARIMKAPVPGSDRAALARTTLLDLQKLLKKKDGASAATKAHLVYLRAQIDEALDLDD